MSDPTSTFKVEYAKSDRSKCKSCQSTIDKDSFRFAIMVQSSKFDGKVPNWYHTQCFFEKVKLIDVKIIKGFDDIRWEDQSKIRDLIQENSKKLSDENDPDETFSVEYAKSSRSRCHGCDLSIVKDHLRLSRKNFSSRRARKYGPVDEWYHVDCFDQIKKDLVFFGTAESFSGFANLNDDDQKKLKEKFGTSTTSSKRKRRGEQTNSGSVRAKQVKIDAAEDSNEEEEKRRKKEQCELLWNYKDNLRKDVPHNVLKELLEFNGQKVIPGEANLIDAVTDCMAFGALEPCPDCSGHLVFNYTNYRCTGNLTEWTKCSYTTQTPKRKPFAIPDDVKETYSIFENYTYTKQDRMLTQVTKRLTVNNEIKEPAYDPKLPLRGYSIGLVGRLSKKPSTLEKQIEQLGGTVVHNLDKKTMDVIISTQGNTFFETAFINIIGLIDEIDNGNRKIQYAQKYDIHVVPEEFLDEVHNDPPSVVMDKIKISTWGVLPHVRKQRKRVKKQPSATFKSSGRSKSLSSEKVTMKLKGGAAVDPDSGLEETCHVLKNRETGDLFAAVLGRVDITRGTNSYYKIQLLEHDTGNPWFLFRA
ncbi:unnamed protein product [Adineta ricciae]|uniref:NAD(+) ADP-ribosyltransferase n=1 Tax=Adineta ricciae TaxID=249248 RepID=A0A813SSJ5_ADIRI|nr:unnamed protein product [Adineta ricciae]